MVSESIVYKGFRVDVNLSGDLYCMAFGESGIGKSYGCLIVLKALESVGYMTLMIDHNNYNARKALLSKAKYDIIVVDEIEQFDNFDFDEFIHAAKTVIYINRAYDGRYDPICKIAVGKRSISITEVKKW